MQKYSLTKSTLLDIYVYECLQKITNEDDKLCWNGLLCIVGQIEENYSENCWKHNIIGIIRILTLFKKMKMFFKVLGTHYHTK